MISTSHRVAFCLVAYTFFAPHCFAYDYFEHRYIGNLASEMALASIQTEGFKKDLDSAAKELGFQWNGVKVVAQALTGKSAPGESYFLREVPVRFGDLSAISGDLAENTNELITILACLTARDTHENKHRINKCGYDSRYNKIVGSIWRDQNVERDSTLTQQDGPKLNHTYLSNVFLTTRRQWESVCRWVKTIQSKQSNGNEDHPLDECVTAALDTIDSSQQNRYLGPISHGYMPSRNELGEFESLSNFASLAGRNRTHFPTHSWETYRANHLLAMSFAACYWQRTHHLEWDHPECAYSKNGIDYLMGAITYEGFAQHFLQDSFSSGHIGAAYGFCPTEALESIPVLSMLSRIPVMCLPTKEFLQHVHDMLNEIGLDVKVTGLISEILPQPNVLKARLDLDAMQQGWKAAGDRHLLTREAAFHRRIVSHVAAASLREIFETAMNNKSGSQCRMCSKHLFPIPLDESLMSPEASQYLATDYSPSQYNLLQPSGNKPPDLAAISPDPRVPRLGIEGWKVLASIGMTSSGLRRGSIWDNFPNSKDFKDPTIRPSTHTVQVFEIGYVRDTGPGIPNYLGTGFLYAPGIGRTSIYPVSFGWWGPREQTELPLTVGIRANLGFRFLNAMSDLNPQPDGLEKFEATITTDVMYSIYKPLALYIRTDLASWTSERLLMGSRVDSAFSNGAITMTFGFKLDLAGIL